jgi:hypothetical protein
MMLIAAVALAAAPVTAAGRYQELTLRYVGASSAVRVTVEQTTQGGLLASAPLTSKTKTVIFDATVQPGDTLELVGADRNGTLGPVVRIRVDRKMNATIRTNCSLDLVPGMRFGDFEVVDAQGDCSSSDDGEGDDGEGDDGGGDDGEGDPDCGECDGQVTSLTLIYHGEEEAEIVVTQRLRGDEVTVFEGLVEPDQPFSFEGANLRGTLGAMIFLYADGHFKGSIHTSCSEPIGPGTVVGDFEVVEGESRHGGRLCPLEDDDGQMSCDECEGQVIELTLRYNGDEAANVKIVQRVRGHNEILVDELMEPGQVFTIYGANRNGTLGAKVKIFIDAARAGEIHTSCSEPIGPGLVVGDLEVLDGSSRRGGRLCPLSDDGGGA